MWPIDPSSGKLTISNSSNSFHKVAYDTAWRRGRENYSPNQLDKMFLHSYRNRDDDYWPRRIAEPAHTFLHVFLDSASDACLDRTSTQILPSSFWAKHQNWNEARKNSRWNQDHKIPNLKFESVRIWPLTTTRRYGDKHRDSRRLTHSEQHSILAVHEHSLIPTHNSESNNWKIQTLGVISSL